MTIILSEEIKERLIEMKLGEGFLDSLGTEFDNEYVDPNGETVFILEYDNQRYMIEGQVKGDTAELVDIGPVTTLQGK